MRLADFILRDMQPILRQWEAFASSHAAGSAMTQLELRDHAQEILLAVAKDLSTPQTPEAQTAKSMGLAPPSIDALETAAQTHGLLRAHSGFDIKQMASEYRALRASVLRLWTAACQPEPPDLEDMIRFNEAIDQALAESIVFFSDKVDEARNLVLGMLGHDMRTPLQSILLTASYLGQLDAGDKVSAAAVRLISSGARMKGLLDELVEFNRANLGLGVRVSPANVDLADLFADELQELRIAYPSRELMLEVTGDTKGCWDGPRLQRVLGNLVVNAVKYGDSDAQVRVVIAEEAGGLRFDVRNTGPAIDQPTLQRLFEPLERGHRQDNSTIQMLVLAWGYTSPAKLPRLTAARSRPARRAGKLSFPCACLAASPPKVTRPRWSHPSGPARSGGLRRRHAWLQGLLPLAQPRRRASCATRLSI